MELPKYAALVLGDYRCALRLLPNGSRSVYPFSAGDSHYYRDAGHWSVGFRIVEAVHPLDSDKIVAVGTGPAAHLDGLVLHPITFKEWEESNEGYTKGIDHGCGQGCSEGCPHDYSKEVPF